MHSKIIKLGNFSRTAYSQASCLRPEHEEELADYLAKHTQHSLLARGSGLSYNDSCFNTNGFVINNQRFNHLISFDEKTGVVVCQGGVLLHDLFRVHPDFIPAVIPGTLYATVAGSIAHDVHGKNNPHQGSFGRHIVWLELLTGTKKFRCSREKHSDLFQATIAGLGLTGIITRVALRLQKKSRYVVMKQQKYETLPELLHSMTHYGLEHDYQVAWLDLLRDIPRGVLSVADYCQPFPLKAQRTHSIPYLPFSIINSWNMKLFNKIVFQRAQHEKHVPLSQFNNPLDKLTHWNRLYGPKGLIQFQALFNITNADKILMQFIEIMRAHKAVPILSVLKLFTQSGEGLLSFCKPGFTLAVDFIYNQQARDAIKTMNRLVIQNNGRIYLAKDMLLCAEEYQEMDLQQNQFAQTLRSYACTMRSDLSNRLRITP